MNALTNSAQVAPAGADAAALATLNAAAANANDMAELAETAYDDYQARHDTLVEQASAMDGFVNTTALNALNADAAAVTAELARNQAEAARTSAANHAAALEAAIHADHVVDTVAARNALAGLTAGKTAYVYETRVVYRWTGSAWAAVSKAVPTLGADGRTEEWARRIVTTSTLLDYEALVVPHAGGGWDWSVALQTLIDELAGDGVSGGRIVVPHEGEDVFLGNVDIKTYVEIVGAGPGTRLVHTGAAVADGAIGAFNGGVVSYLLGVNARNAGAVAGPVGLRISDVTLVGRGNVAGFAEHHHLLAVCGCADLVVERFRMLYPQGDGISLGGTVYGSATFANDRVTIRDGLIKGHNHTNRNGISVIDGRDVLIENVHGEDLTKADMPGFIDIEPDDKSWQRVERITVRHCSTRNQGGNVGAFAVFLRKRAEHNPGRIAFEDLTVLSQAASGTGSAFYFGVGSATAPNATRGDRSMNLHNVRPFVKDYKRPLALFGVCGYREVDAYYRDCAEGPLVGYREAGATGPSSRNVDVAFRRFRWERLGLTSGTGALIYDVDGLDLERGHVLDCGLPSGATGYPAGNPFTFFRGEAKRVRETENTYESTGAMNAGPVRATGADAPSVDDATYERRHNRYVGYAPSNRVPDDEPPVRHAELVPVLADTFDRADGALGTASGVGGAWDGTLTVQSNAAGAPVAATLAYAHGGAAVADAVVAATAAVSNPDTNGLYGLRWRESASVANYVSFRRYPSGYCEATERKGGGAEVTVGTGFVAASTGADETVRGTLDGRHLRVTVNGAVAVECVVTLLAPGRCGVDARGTGRLRSVEFKQVVDY